MEYLNIGLSVSGFVDVPKQNIMAMWKNSNSSSRSSDNKRRQKDMNELKAMNKKMFQSYEDYVNGNGSGVIQKKRKKKVNGIEKFLSKPKMGQKKTNFVSNSDNKDALKMDIDNKNQAASNSNSKESSRKRKRKGAMFQYLTDKQDKRDKNEPPLKRRKLVMNYVDDDDEIHDKKMEKKGNDLICEKCDDVICKRDDIKKDILIQTHMDEHLAEELSKQLNTIPQKMLKRSNKKKGKSGIMNYFKKSTK